MKQQNIFRVFYVIIVLTLTIGNSFAYRHGMTMITPATQWRDAMPSGNGTIGAMVYGSINQECVLFNHNELWFGGRIDEVPDMSAELDVVRKLASGQSWKDGKSLE